MKLRVLLTLLILLLYHNLAYAQAGGWIFPTASNYAASAFDNGVILSTENVPGGVIVVSLPNPSVVGADWSMAFSSTVGRGIIVNAPVGVYILTGQKQMTSFTVPSNVNYEYFTIQSDGTNFRVLTSTDKTKLWNGTTPAFGGEVWTRITSTGYSVNLADNNTVLSSAGLSDPPGTVLTATLPSIPLLPNGWSIELFAANDHPIIIQTNPVQGGVLGVPPGYGATTTFTVPPNGMARVSFTGTVFHVFVYATNVIPAVANTTDLQNTDTVVAPNGIWRLTYSNSPVTGAPPLFFTPSTSPCSINAGTGDGGSQVPSHDGKCWLAKFPPGPLDVRQWGVNTANSDNYAFVVAAATVAGQKCTQIQFPQGKFFINSQVVIPRCAGIKGEGRPQNNSSSGIGTILDFSGLPALTDAIVTGSDGNSSQMVKFEDFQIQNATKNCMTLSIRFANIDNVAAIACAGEGIHIDDARSSSLRNIQISSCGQHGLSLNGNVTTGQPDELAVTLENVNSQLNTLDGFFLNNVHAVTIIGSSSVTNDRGFYIQNSDTVSFIGSDTRTNRRAGYSFFNSKGILESARGFSNDTSSTDAASFLVANSNSNVDILQTFEDLAPSGVSVIATNSSTVRRLGTFVGSSSADVTSLNEPVAGVLSVLQTPDLGGGSLAAGQCQNITVALNGVRQGSGTVTVTPINYPGDGFTWYGFIPSDNLVQVFVCATVAGSPGVTGYKVRVLRG